MTAPLPAGEAVSGAFVSVVEVVSVPGGLVEGLAETSAGDGAGDGGGAAGGVTIDCALALKAKSTTRIVSKANRFIMIFLIERFDCR